MSKSLYNNSSCGKGGCSSKSLTNTGQFGTVSSDQSVTQFISTQNQTPSSSNPSTGIPLVVDNLTVNNNLDVLGTGNINMLNTNSISICSGGMNLLCGSITSNTTNIELHPFNPTPCSGYVLIENNLRVNGCFTDLCTTDTYIKDPVPTINFCTDGTFPVDDNNDVGIEMRYAEPTSFPLIQNNAFIGLDRSRFVTGGPRFVMWYDTDIIGAPDQNFKRVGTKANGLDIDTIYTYLIKNPDNPDSPATIPGGYSKSDINIEASDEFLVKASFEKHDIGNWEKHTIGTFLTNVTGFRVEDANNLSCNFIELARTAFPGGQAAAYGGKAGLYLWHETNVDINACTGTVKIGPQIGGNDGTNVGGVPLLFIDDVCIEAGNKLETNTINEKSTNLTIQTTFGLHNLSLISAGQTSITANVGDISLSANPIINAGGGANVIRIEPGILFNNASITGNPSTLTDRQKTIWYDNTGGIGSNTSNFKTFYPIVDNVNYPFVVSASQNNATNNKLSMYHDNSGWSIEKTEIEVFSFASSNDSLNGVCSIIGCPYFGFSFLYLDANLIFLGNDLTDSINITGAVTATNINNQVAADSLIFRVPGGLPNSRRRYVDDLTSGTSSIIPGDNFRLLYLDSTGTGTIKLFNEPPNGPGNNYLCVDPAGVPSWAPIGAIGPIGNLQDAYNNTFGSPAIIQINSTHDQIIIMESNGAYPNQPLFEVLDFQANPYFQVGKTSGNSGNILIGDNNDLAIDFNILYGTFHLHSSTSNGNEIMHIEDNGFSDLFRIYERSNTLPSIIIQPQNNGASGNIALSIQNNGNVDKIIFTPNSAGKIATFFGDIDVTGTIDPIAIVFQGQPNSNLINPIDPGLGNGSIYVKNLADFFGPIDTTSLMFIETNTSGPSSPMERPVVLFEMETAFGFPDGYYDVDFMSPVNVTRCIPVFSTGYGNKVTTSQVNIDIDANITGINTLSTGVIGVQNSYNIDEVFDPEVIIITSNSFFSNNIRLPQASSVPGRKYTIINAANNSADVISTGGDSILDKSIDSSGTNINQDTTQIYVSVHPVDSNTWYRIV